MKWIVRKHFWNDVEFEEAQDAAEYITENCGDECYDDYLDDCYDEVIVCGYRYCPSDALKSVDPVAYRCGRSDWESFEAVDIAYELDRMNDGDEDEFYGFFVSCAENEDEDEDEDGGE